MNGYLPRHTHLYPHSPVLTPPPASYSLPSSCTFPFILYLTCHTCMLIHLYADPHPCICSPLTCSLLVCRGGRGAQVDPT